MSGRTVFWKSLRDLRWQVLWYGAGLALLAALVVFIYPSYSEQLQNFEIPEALKGFLGDAGYTTPEGFLSAEFFSFAPAVLIIFAIMSATNALGGEEANGTLELLLAQPVSRVRVMIEKMASLVLATVGILLITMAGWLVSVPVIELDISYADLLLATIAIAPLVFAFQAIALWATAALPDRKLATGLVTLLAVASYLAAYLAAVVDVLRPLRWVSLFHYHDGTNALTHGANLDGNAVLLGVTALFSLLAIWAFTQREIGAARGLRLPLPRRPRDLPEPHQP